MTAPRFLLIGGFLGAGKTTTIARLARHYQSQGLNVAIVTNDQAANLVDTNSLRSQGFEVGEVAGSCFCCNFNALTSVVESMSAHARPDVILAEPVGSCTDLVATIIKPLKQLYDVPFDVAPYAVIVKPSHGLKILKEQADSGFSAKAAYIFRKQIEEADFVVINRVDELPAAEVNELAALIEQQFPGRPVLKLSAKTGQGFDALLEFLDQQGEFGRRVMELDYDIYAEGEAELGWLNSQVVVKSARPFGLDGLLLDLIERLKDSLAASDAETAHLKVIGLADGAYGVANLVSSFTGSELSLPSSLQTREANVVVNARVAVDPADLDRLVRETVVAAAEAAGATAEVISLQSFRPGRPVPTHRILN